MQPKTENSQKLSRWLTRAFSALLVAAGFGFSAFWAFPTFLKSVSSRSWHEVPAKIISSEVTSRSGKNGRSYGIDVTYEYTWQSKTYKSDCHDFLDFSSSGRADKEAVVRSLPPGKTVPCWVNPKKPEEAVLFPGLSLAHFVLLLPLVFFVVGCLFLIRGLDKTSAQTALAPPDELLSVPLPTNFLHDASLPLELKPAPVFWSTISLAVFAVLWNCFVVFLLQETLAQKNTGWSTSLFPALFSIIGIVLLFAAVRKILALKNPRPSVSLYPPRVHPGRKHEISWSMTGGPHRLESLRINLCCVKISVVGSGKHRRAKRETLFEETLFDSSSRPDFVPGDKLGFTMPKNALPSGEADGGAVVWFFSFEGAIPRWPDMKAEIPFPVYSSPNRVSLTPD